MYIENANKFLNYFHDGEQIHVYINATSRNRKWMEGVLENTFYLLNQVYVYTRYEAEYLEDEQQFYLVIADYEELKWFKESFFRSLRK